MQTSISLQDLYGYSAIPLLASFIIFSIMTVYIVIKINSKKQKSGKKEEQKVILEKNIKNIPAIKSKYLEKINDIDAKYKSGKISLRKAYQQISEAVRYFVFEVTGISTQNFSLSEIKNANIPGLYDLIEEYYEPEFASKTNGDFDSAISKARRIINEWN